MRTGCLVLVAALTLLAGPACKRSSEEWLLDLRHGDAHERRMALLALREVPDGQISTVLALVIPASGDDSPGVAEAARETAAHLARRSPRVLVEALRTYGAASARVRRGLCRLIVEVGEPAAPALAEVARDEADPLRETAAGLLAEIEAGRD